MNAKNNWSNWGRSFFASSIVGILSTIVIVAWEIYFLEIWPKPIEILNSVLISISFMGPTGIVICLLRHRIVVAEANASTDPLTGLLNRRGAENAFRIERQLLLREQRSYQVSPSEEKPVSILMIDVDGFKSLNDRRGHAAGDEILQGIASLIKRAFPRESDLAFRFGGDEFGVVLLNTKRASATRLAEELRKTVFDIYRSEGITLSIGISSQPMLESTLSSKDILEKLILDADSCLYHSKRNGKNQVTSLIPIIGYFKETSA